MTLTANSFLILLTIFCFICLICLIFFPTEKQNQNESNKFRVITILILTIVSILSLPVTYILANFLTFIETPSTNTQPYQACIANIDFINEQYITLIIISFIPLVIFLVIIGITSVKHFQLEKLKQEYEFKKYQQQAFMTENCSSKENDSDEKISKIDKKISKIDDQLKEMKNCKTEMNNRLDTTERQIKNIQDTLQAMNNKNEHPKEHTSPDNELKE